MLMIKLIIMSDGENQDQENQIFFYWMGAASSLKKSNVVKNPT